MAFPLSVLIPVTVDCRGGTATIGNSFGVQRLAVFLVEFVDAPVLVEGPNTMNTFMATLLDTGFTFMTARTIEAVIANTPTTENTAFHFDLRAADRASLIATNHGVDEEYVSADIGASTPIDRDFRDAARSGGRVLGVAGVGLNIDPNTGRYDLADAAAAGNLTAGVVPVR